MIIPSCSSRPPHLIDDNPTTVKKDKVAHQEGNGKLRGPSNDLSGVLAKEDEYNYYEDKYAEDCDTSVSSHAGLSGLLLECEADIQKEQDAIFGSLSYRSSRSTRTPLATLEEEGNNVEDDGHLVSTPQLTMSSDLSSNLGSRTEDTEDSAREGVLDHSEIKFLNNKASKLALTGNEEEALKTYKRALRLARIEVNRINKQLLQSREREKVEKTTLHIILRDEWTEVAFTIANIRTMMAILYERLGDYERALMCCNEAREVYERQSQFDEKEKKKKGVAVERMKQMNHMTMKMQDAKDTFQQRKELHEEALEAHRQICISPDLAVRDLLYEALFDKLSAALGLELDSLGGNHPQVSDTMTFLSKIQQERLEINKALVSMSRAVSIAEVSLGTMHPRTGEKYREIARMLEDTKRSEEDINNAILYYEQAINTFQKADGDHSLLIGSILNDVGVLHIRRKQYDIAVQRFSDALAAYESSPMKHDVNGTFILEVSQVWRNLAECHALRKNWSSASMAFKSALDIQRDAKKIYEAAAVAAAASKNGDDDNINDDEPALIKDENIADTLKRLGKSFAAQQKYNQSIDALLEALTILQTVHDKLQTPETQDQVANIVYCIAEVKESDKMYSEALRLYKESLELRTESDKSRPKKKKANHVHCAMCLAGIGSVRMARKEYDHAFKAYSKAIRLAKNEKLPESHPILKMLWDKSKAAAHKMGESSLIGASGSSGDSTIDTWVDESKGQLLDDDIVQGDADPVTTGRKKASSSLHYTLSRLQKKASVQKSKRDIDGAIETTKIILELRRASLSNRQEEGKRDCSKAKKHVADALVSLAYVVLIKEATKEAELYFKEAAEIYKSSGKKKEDICMQEISRELDRLRWQQKCTNSRK